MHAHPQEDLGTNPTLCVPGHAVATAGDWVLQNRPAAVVVETACTPEHGADPGRGVTCRDQVQGEGKGCNSGCKSELQ